MARQAGPRAKVSRLPVAEYELAPSSERIGIVTRLAVIVNFHISSCYGHLEEAARPVIISIILSAFLRREIYEATFAIVVEVRNGSVNEARSAIIITGNGPSVDLSVHGPIAASRIIIY